MAKLRRLSRVLYVSQRQLLVTPPEPRVAQVVVDDGKGLAAQCGVDVVAPQRARFEEVLIGIDDRDHQRSLYPRAPTVSWEKFRRVSSDPIRVFAPIDRTSKPMLGAPLRSLRWAAPTTSAAP